MSVEKQESSLFRSEAIEARRHQLTGSARSTNTPALKMTAAAAVAILAILIAALSLGTYTRKVAISGVLLPENGLAGVGTPTPGTVSAVHVEVGQYVVEGQSVVSLRQDRRIGAESLEASRASAFVARSESLELEFDANLSQHQARQMGLKTRLRGLEAEVVRLQEFERIAQARLVLTEQKLERVRDLVEKGFVNKAQLDEQSEALLEQRQRLSQAKGAVDQVRLEIAQSQSELVQSQRQVEALSASKQRTAAGLAQDKLEASGQTNWEVTAPASGWVYAITASVGQGASPNQQLVSIATAQGGEKPKLKAFLFGTSDQMGFVRMGQEVQLRVDAFPHDKFGSVPSSVSEVTNAPMAMPDLPNGFGQEILAKSKSVGPVYRVSATLSSQRISGEATGHELRTGMRVTGLILRDTRSIWEWWLRPILGRNE